MADTKISKSESSFRKANLYKDATMNALKEVTEFDSKIINSNDKYLVLSSSQLHLSASVISPIFL